MGEVIQFLPMILISLFMIIWGGAWVIARWRLALIFVIFGLAVYAINTYTKTVIAIVLTTTVTLKYLELRDKGKPSFLDAVFWGIKITSIVLIVGFGISTIISELGQHYSYKD
ncbi:hypothetical protein TW78_16215 [Vibrio coralliilyticus]|uniref:Uncharacterized protein n=1 Tax=Vibrio coralliilyticus TaxID=190893 RepID=A0A837GB55_9VIBR|nr:hypothetical protein [Vibrio coralliilyticus]KJY71000.1 hypothetical protein TW78_16215 [Vibrio coralliilyticus]QOU31014.1 hypothetical protein TW71_005760 [Vibrio coralliilyticus]